MSTPDPHAAPDVIPPPGDLETRSVRELLERLSHQVAELVRAEIALVKADTAERVKEAIGGAAMLAIAGVTGLAILGALTAALILGLASVMPAWAAALVAAGALGLVAAGLALTGRARLRRSAPPVPQTAIEHMKEDVEWLTSRGRSSSESS